MALFGDSLLVDFTVAIFTLIIVASLFLNERYKYWKIRGVPYAKPFPLFGSFKENAFGKEHIFETHCKIYNELKGEKFGGFFEFHAPNLMIKDPDLIYRVLVKDFAHFHDRGMFPADPKNDPLSYTIATMTGQDWRTLRQKLSPAFTSGKLKGMMEQMCNSGEHLVRELDKVASDRRPVDCKDILSIFTIDVIASCAFGLQFDLDSPEGQRFKAMITTSLPSSLASLVMLLRMMYTKLSGFLGLTTFSREVTDYFVNLSKETVRHRKEQGVRRNDFLQILIDLKETEETTLSQDTDDAEDDDVINQLKFSSVYSKDLQSKKVMTDECLAATSFIFLLGGTEVATVMTFAMYSIATHAEVQEKLQREVDQVLAKHKTLNYQAIKDMVYLDKVLTEAMRMYPICAFINRVCTIPYRIPDTDVVIEKDTRVTIPVWALHRDPQYHSDPDVFNPERYFDPNYKPSPTNMPFGDGPRICIAMRFAILEMKVCIARIMSQYKISLSKETKLPIKFESKGITPRIQGGLKIMVAKRM